MASSKFKKFTQTIRVPYALSVHGDEEATAVSRVIKEHRTGLGKETTDFEKRIAKLFGKKHGIMVNSGSSANLLAFEVLNLPAGSEVITPALTFNTTLAPIIQKGLTPVFVDVVPGTYLADIDVIEKRISPRTKALMIPSLLGNIPDMARLRILADAHHLFFIEDSCDTLGARYNGKSTGFYSHISTTSFYGSHVINAGGGGGMICVNDSAWADRLRVLRGWGRTSALFADSEDIAKRFTMKLDGIPYDAKFIFSEVGYNFLPLEISAAFGRMQLAKLPVFIQHRRNNFDVLINYFSKWERFFVPPSPTPGSKTSWISFPLTIREPAPFSRLELVTYLERRNIQTRPIFSGNILRQPGYRALRTKKTEKEFPVADAVMRNGFVIGCHQGLEEKHLNYLRETFDAFLKRYE